MYINRKAFYYFFQLASIRGRYRTMSNEDQASPDSFIMGFTNPITESSVDCFDKADGKVTILGYRPLREDADKYGFKGKIYVVFLLGKLRKSRDSARETNIFTILPKLESSRQKGEKKTQQLNHWLSNIPSL